MEYRRKFLCLLSLLLVLALLAGCGGASKVYDQPPGLTVTVNGTDYLPNRGTTSWFSSKAAYDVCCEDPRAWGELLVTVPAGRAALNFVAQPDILGVSAAVRDLDGSFAQVETALELGPDGTVQLEPGQLVVVSATWNLRELGSGQYWGGSTQWAFVTE